MDNTIHLKSYAPPPINRKEILRYAGICDNTPRLDGILDECIKEVTGKLTYKVCYSEFPLECNGNSVDISFAKTESSALSKNLRQCTSVIVFAATVGLNIDRLIARYASASPTKALLLQAIGSERIESLCDAFNEDIKAEKERIGSKIRPRFSPGYGDFSLEIQKDIVSVLDCYRKIGIVLNESLLMVPLKSVTAVIGVV